MSESPNRAHSWIDDERNDLPVPGTSWYANCQVRKPCAYIRVYFMHIRRVHARVSLLLSAEPGRLPGQARRSKSKPAPLPLPSLRQLCGQLTSFPEMNVESPRAEAISFQDSK